VNCNTTYLFIYHLTCETSLEVHQYLPQPVRKPAPQRIQALVVCSSTLFAKKVAECLQRQCFSSKMHCKANMRRHVHFLWLPCAADADIIFLPMWFLLSIFFFPRLILSRRRFCNLRRLRIMFDLKKSSAVSPDLSSSQISVIRYPFLFLLRLDAEEKAQCLNVRLPYFHTQCGLSANLGCRSETFCTQLAENVGRKKSPSAHHRTTLSGYVFATKALSTIGKKLVKLQYLLHMSSQYGGLRPTNG